MNENSKQLEIPGFFVTKEFLEYVFEREVEAFTVKLGTNPGDNYLSIIYAVDANFKGKHESDHFLIKCYPNHPERQKLLDELKVFEKEFFIYNDFLPVLKKIIEEQKIKKDNDAIQLSFAQFFGGIVTNKKSAKFENTPWADKKFIIMNDLRHLHYKMGDRINGMDLDHATVVLEAMAKLHAISWAYKEKSGLKLLSSKFPNLLDELYHGKASSVQIKSMMHQTNQVTLKVIEEHLGDQHPAYKNLKILFDSEFMDVIRTFMRPQEKDEQIFEALLRVSSEDNPEYIKEPWLTGTHGDCWVNNILFKYEECDGRLKPIDAVFVDFQMFREACPTVDMAYFFYTSIREPIRNKFKNKLLETYYDTFMLCCNVFEVSPYPGFSMDSLRRRLRRSELYGFLVALPLLCVHLKPVEPTIDMDKREGKNAAELYSKLLEGCENNEEFNKEVIATVLNLFKRGII